ncbi:unnamed protein product [Pleuronectes platessa]|uniref:Uncharacterized protein n=1 Tax=Pleuronectes platessa TaxID=8262 RepID=A0A9N7U8R9_PLEPL|nr:unnamed protein product [Pleuronectes platessa]
MVLTSGQRAPCMPRPRAQRPAGPPFRYRSSGSSGNGHREARVYRQKHRPERDNNDYPASSPRMELDALRDLHHLLSVTVPLPGRGSALPPMPPRGFQEVNHLAASRRSFLLFGGQPRVKMREAWLFKSWADSRTHEQLVPQGPLILGSPSVTSKWSSVLFPV